MGPAHNTLNQLPGIEKKKEKKKDKKRKMKNETKKGLSTRESIILKEARLIKL